MNGWFLALWTATTKYPGRRKVSEHPSVGTCRAFRAVLNHVVF